jgi:Carboxypeptidase regulatory-like domain
VGACRGAVLLGAVVLWIAPPARIHAQARTRVRGMVFDSIASGPLARALVQVVNVEERTHIAFSGTSDSLGRFLFDEVPAGHYIAGFYHPMLDSLGLAGAQREFAVAPSAADSRLDLFIPSPVRVLGAHCGTPATEKERKADSSGMFLGYVLDSRTLKPVAGATVTVRWMELLVGRKGFARDLPTRIGYTDDTGWFVVCGLPSGTEVVVNAARGADSSGPVELRVPESRLLRRTVFVGPPPPRVLAVVTADSARAESTRTTDSSAVDSKRAGLALTGWVRTEEGVPIVGARVHVFGTDPTVLTDDKGEFALHGLPGGTHMIETRAIGFFPDDRPVDLTDQQLPMFIAMTTLRRVLDTVHVKAMREGLRRLVGFESRKQTAPGHFLTSSDIERMHSQRFTDVLRRVSSLQLVNGPRGLLVKMRGDAPCKPALFVDGARFTDWELSDIDGIVRPEDLDGLEVYTPGQAPPQFLSREGCGSIVMWTRVAERGRRKPAP